MRLFDVDVDVDVAVASSRWLKQCSFRFFSVDVADVADVADVVHECHIELITLS